MASVLSSAPARLPEPDAVAAETWDKVAGAPRPSWYLDPLVAAQKRSVHLELIGRWLDHVPTLLLKTDLFEEANGSDRILFDLRPQCGRAVALDISPETIRRARANQPPGEDGFFLAADLRRIGLKSGSIDCIISTSTLDHFAHETDFRRALAELVRILRPGGQLIVTVDNPVNPLYWPLRWLCRLRGAPFPLGYTPTLRGLIQRLQDAGLEVSDTACLIHNPRVLSTALFLTLRRLFGEHANGLIQLLLRLFASLGRLPTRQFTACFVGACARKPL